MQKLNKNGLLSLLSIAFRLFIVCTVIAALVGTVNYITKDVIAEHELEKTYSALDSVFYPASIKENGVDVEYEKTEAQISQSVTDIYEIYYTDKTNNKNLAGYGVLCEPTGFKDVIKMLVAFNSDTSIASVKIISLSETVGIGDKVKSDTSFAEQFKNKKNAISFGVDVSAISGATVSSKAVTRGVNDAISVLKIYLTDNEGGEING